MADSCTTACAHCGWCCLGHSLSSLHSAKSLSGWALISIYALLAHFSGMIAPWLLRPESLNHWGKFAWLFGQDHYLFKCRGTLHNLLEWLCQRFELSSVTASRTFTLTSTILYFGYGHDVLRKGRGRNDANTCNNFHINCTLVPDRAICFSNLWTTG